MADPAPVTGVVEADWVDEAVALGPGTVVAVAAALVEVAGDALGPHAAESPARTSSKPSEIEKARSRRGTASPPGRRCRNREVPAQSVSYGRLQKVTGADRDKELRFGAPYASLTIGHSSALPHSSQEAS